MLVKHFIVHIVGAPHKREIPELYDDYARSTAGPVKPNQGAE